MTLQFPCETMNRAKTGIQLCALLGVDVQGKSVPDLFAWPVTQMSRGVCGASTYSIDVTGYKDKPNLATAIQTNAKRML